jgi:predicted dehydrogenase
VTVGTTLGVGVVGAGRFGQFVASVAATLPETCVVGVTDTDLVQARRLAECHRADVAADPAGLLGDDKVDAVVIATPPNTHASLSLQALAAGRHVFCEKPLALTEAEAATVRDAAVASGRSFVVDHVLRYNPVLAALRRLHDAGVLGAVQRFAFENDAADEDLPRGHWFWDDATSGGILLEHGVHFFDAAAMLIGAPAQRVQAIGTRRADGRTDTVVCTVAHAGGALATHAHGFSHAHRAERQLMRLDYGLAEARVHGWIPLRAELDVWTDRVDVFERIAVDAGDLLAVPGITPSGHESIDVAAERDVAPADARARGVPCRAPHHVSIRIDLGGPERKPAVYRDSVAAALLDLVSCAQTGSTPQADVDAGHTAVQVAAAGTAALRDGHIHHLPDREQP